MRIRTCIIGLMGSMTLSLLVGCTGEGPAIDSAGPSSRGPSSASLAPAAPSGTPLVDELVFSQETELSHQVRDSLVSDCMQRSGKPYSPEPFIDSDRQFEATLNSVEWRRENGYGVVLGVDVSQTVRDTSDSDSANDRYVSQLPGDEFEQWQLALDQCRIDADEVVAGQVQEFQQSLSEEDRALIESISTYSHPLLDESVDSWVQCMAQRGYEFSNPYEPQQSVVDAYEQLVGERDPATVNSVVLEDLLETERQTAVDDLECSAEPTRVAAALTEELETVLETYGPRETWGRS